MQNETDARSPRYKNVSEGTPPSYRAELSAAVVNMASRIALGYQGNCLIALDETNGQEFQPPKGGIW